MNSQKTPYTSLLWKSFFGENPPRHLDCIFIHLVKVTDLTEFIAWVNLLYDWCLVVTDPMDLTICNLEQIIDMLMLIVCVNRSHDWESVAICDVKLKIFN